ncbi:hypothetical protein [Ekhidna sp.]|uniref:hypothetical protein n=1 Tax=Ekhidna sp. TaxID=2608089 RepID=UPI00329813BB
MSTQSSIETHKVAGAIASMGIDELIFNMAKGIADGQAKLDETCMKLAVQMGDAQIEFGKIPGTNEPDLISLVELGFTPNFYQFVDTILEINVSVTSQYEEEKEIVKSDIDSQSDEKVSQTQYAHQRNNNYSAYGYGRSWGYGYGYSRWGYGGYGYGVSGGSNTNIKENTAQKTKTVKVNTVDASFSSKYGYEVAASSVIKTKIVPIPPPQVLEEAVQNAAKERKEWAKRFALLRYSKIVFSDISDSAVKSKEVIGGFLEHTEGGETVPASTPDYGAAKTIQDDLISLNEEYVKLNNDHWSVIEKVKDRRNLDTYFDSINKSVTKLMDNYAEEKLKKAIDTDALNAELQASFDLLINIKTKLDEIQERLPLTPEEQAKKDEEEEAKADSES